MCRIRIFIKFMNLLLQINFQQVNEQKKPKTKTNKKNRSNQVCAGTTHSHNTNLRWCTIWSVCNGAHLYPFLCLQKRGVCGRVGHRVMLMRRSNVCSRTCHRTEASALHLLKPVEVFKGSWTLRNSTAVSGEPRRSALCGMGGVGRSTPPRQFRLPAVASVWSLSANRLRKVIHSEKTASGMMNEIKASKTHLRTITE